MFNKKPPKRLPVFRDKPSRKNRIIVAIAVVFGLVSSAGAVAKHQDRQS